MRPDSLDALLDPSAAPPISFADAHESAPSLAPSDEPANAPAFPRDGCGALVLGGSHGALAVVRSLGRNGIPVWFANDDNVLARLSRYTAKGVSGRARMPRAPRISCSNSATATSSTAGC